MDIKNKVALGMTGASAALLGWMAVSDLNSRPANKTDTRASNAKLTATVNAEDSQLLEQYRTLAQERQAAVFAEVEDKILQETGLDNVCDAILAHIDKGSIVRYEELGKMDPELRTSYDKLLSVDPRAHVYNPEYGVIVIPPPDYYTDMRRILKSSAPPRVILAHEALHAVQEEASPHGKLYRKLFSHYDSVHHKLVLSEDTVRQIAASFFNEKNPSAETLRDIEKKFPHIFEGIKMWDYTGGLCRELQARLIWPVLDGKGNLQLSRDILRRPGMTDETLVAPYGELERLVPVIVSGYGAHADKVSTVDVYVARWVGSWSGDKDTFAPRIYQDPLFEKNKEQGLAYLSERSARIRESPTIARRVLRAAMEYQK